MDDIVEFASAQRDQAFTFTFIDPHRLERFRDVKIARF